jgi:hypothetical protein
MNNMLIINVFSNNGNIVTSLTVPVEINVQDLSFFVSNEISKVVNNWSYAQVFFSDNVTTTSVGRIYID